MTENTTPLAEELIYVVKDPSGTPLDRYVTITNLAKALETIYGNLYEYSSANSITVTTLGTYYGWTTAAAVVSGMTADLADATGDNLVADTAGKYSVQGSFSFGATANSTIQGAIHVDGAIASDSPRFVRKIGSGGDTGSASIGGILTLAAAEEVSMRFTSDGNGDVISIDEFSLTLVRVGA
jgi:hypothetical protein